MKKILFIIYYELKEFFLSIKDSFEKYLYEIDSYPLFRYAYDANDKLDNYKLHMNEYIKKSNPDIILWWFIDVPIDIFKFIKTNNPNVYFIMYNIDETINMSAEILKKASVFDLVMTCTKENILKYKIHSKVSDIIYNPFSYDPEYFYSITPNNFEEDDKQYNCDISIVIYNLMIDTGFFNAQYVNVIKYITDLISYCNKNNKIIKLYGTPVLKEYFKDFYQGELPYLKLNKLHNLSKINITFHNFCNKSLYINENVMQILGSGGLLLMDRVKDIDKILPNDTCLFIDKNDYIKQIDNILNNYESFKIIKSNAVKISKKFTWDEWVKKIHVHYCTKFFDAQHYIKTYNLEHLNDKCNDDVVSYWLNNGILNNDIPYKIEVPESFLFEEYNSKYNLGYNKILSYYHWFNYSKEQIFIKNNNSSKMVDCNNLCLQPEDLIYFFNICNNIYNDVNRDDNLIKLHLFSKNNPYFKINDALDNYFVFCNK